MRKIFTLFALLFFTVGITSAQVLTENFDYTAGQALTANGWTAHNSGGTNTILVTTPGLTYSGHPGSGVGNAATLATSGEDINRGFTAINSGSVYMSFLVNLSAVQGGDYFIGLYQTSSIFPLRVYAKTDGAGGYLLGISKGSGAVSYDATSRSFGTTYFVVVNYTFNTGTTTDDVLNLWINPALGGSEPTPTVAAVSAGSDGSSISAVYLRQGSAGTAATPQVDAILVGSTWAQVAPAASSSPSLSASSLTSFANVCVNTTAGPNSFTISGSNLTTADVSVAALAGFTYSTTSGGTYTSTLTIPQTGGTFSQQVFVKFSPTAVQSYNGNIVVSGGGAASSVNVAAVGGGVNAPPTVTTGTTTGITTVAATAAGTITDPGCTSITEYGIEYSTINGFTDGAGTKVPASNLSSGAFSSNIGGLTPGVTYYYKAYATNAAGTGYGTQDMFMTTPTGPSLTAGTVADFGNVIINTQSSSQSFTLSGANLTGSTGSVTVSAPSSDFEVSNDDNTWGATTLVAYSAGTISNATVYVRFTPQSLGVKSGDVAIAGGGASTTVAVSGTGIPVPSPLLLTEPFNYTPDGTNDLEAQSGGVWIGANTGDAVLVGAGNLSYSGLTASTGNKITFDGAGKDYFTPFTSQTTGSVYSSFILNVPSLGSLDATGGYIAGFAQENSTSAFGATVWTRASTTAGKYNIGIATRTTTSDVSWIATDLDPGTSYFVVIAYDIATGTANDVSRMWLNPVPGNPEPAAGVTAVAGSDLSSVGRFFVRQDSNNETPFVEMDELRVGTTWAAVTPGGAATPAITISSPLADFGNVCVNTTAGPNSFTIAGSNLTNADVTVAALAGYTYSTTSGGTYTSTLTLPQSGGSFSQQVFVKFAPTAVQSYNGNIVVNGGGISAAVNAAATGAGIDTKPTLTTGSASAITTATATAAGTITDAGCSSVTEYGIEYSTTNGFADGAGTKVPASNLSSGAFSSNLSGLSAGITYYYKAYATNGGGTGYGAQQSFTTTAPTPVITTDALTAFGNVCVNTTAGPNSFTITGSNLTNADVTVAALAGFTYSTTAGGTYTSTLTLPQSGGAYSQQVFVKFAPTAVQSYNGNIVVNGGGISAAVNVAASGAGINTKPAVTTGASSAVTTVTATAAGTITDVGCSSITEYGIEYSTTNGFADGAGTKVPATNLSSGAFSSNLSGLTPGLAYYYKAYATNGGGTGYGAQQTFTTQSLSPSLTAGTVADFGSVAVGSQSASQSFNLSGANLTGAPGSITVTAPSTDFEVSSDNATWGPTATVAFTSATLASTPVYVRFTPQTSGLKTGNVSISGGSANTAVAVSGTGTTASASSLLVEPFNYTADASSGLQAQSNGAWIGINGGDSVLVTSGSLSFTGLEASTGNKIAFDGSGRDYYTGFATQTTGSVYSSFVLNVSSLGSLGTTGGYFTGFIQDNNTSSFGGAVWTRASTTAGKYNIGISTRSNSAVSWLAADLDPGTSYFVVRAYDFMSGTGDDVARIWLNPVPGNPEPTAGATAIAGADMANIGRAFIRQDNTTNTPFVEMDELRVGTDWASVTPGAVITPTLTISSPLAAFGNVCVNTTAGPNSFTISGTNLTNADVSVAALAGFTYSTTSGGTYTSTLTLPQSGGTFSQQVFVKFTPTAVQSYNGNIVVSGGGATASVNAAATGAGVNTAPSVTTGAASGVTASGATAAGTITDMGCTSLTEYGIEYSTTNGFANGSGTKEPASNLSAGAFSSGLSGLAPSTTYYYKAYATNGGGTGYGTQQQFTTASLAPTLAATTVTGFGNICTGTTAGPNSFTISGSNLTTADVAVAALPGFTYSTTSGGTYTATLTIPQSGGTFSQQVFVKFSPVAVQSYNGNIVVSGGGAASAVNVAATGSGVNTAPAVTTGGSSAVTTSTATLAGTITATGCTSVTAYGIEYSTTNGFANGSGTQVASSNIAAGAFTSGLGGLAASTTYYYKAYATNGGGTTYGAQQQFVTAAPPPPTITATTLTAFGSVCVSTTAGPNSFTISGSNLTSAAVTVGALNGFTYSTTSGGTYTSTLSLTQPGGTYSQQVFVKFTPTAVQNYSGNIPVSGGGISGTVNVAASGSGASTAPTVVTGAATNIFTSYATLGGQVTGAGCTGVTQYGIEYSGISGFANGNGTKVFANNLSSGQFSATVNGLVQGSTYYFKAFATNAGGTSYGAEQSFTIASIPAGFTVYPVPAIRGSQFNFSMSGLTPGYYGLLFFSADGRLAYQYNMNIQGGFINQSITLPASLAAGIYRVQLASSTGTVATQSILVQ